MLITILTFVIVSITWLASTFPFLIPYHMLLVFQSRKASYKLTLKHFVIVYIFIYYLTGVLSFTGIFTIFDTIVHNSFGIITSRGLHIPSDEINLVPFRWITEGIRPYIENIFLFVPLGFLLPFIWKKYEVFWRTTLFSFSFSLFIECFQLFNIRRITDIDDLMMNTLGALIGWMLFRLLTERLPGLQQMVCIQSDLIKEFPFLIREEACFYVVIAFMGMFFVYDPFIIYPLLRSLFQ